MAHRPLPTNSDELITWLNAFYGNLASDPGSFGTTPERVAELDATRSNFLARHAKSSDKATNSGEAYEATMLAKAAVLRSVRSLVRQIQAWPQITDDKRRALDITVPDRSRTPAPRPSTPPALDVVYVDGHSVTLRLRDAANVRRSRPVGASGANVLTFVGDLAPTSLAGWTFQGNATTREFSFVAPPTAQPGSRVWITATWYGTRGETGPLAQPVYTHVGFGGVAKAA